MTLEYKLFFRILDFFLSRQLVGNRITVYMPAVDVKSFKVTLYAEICMSFFKSAILEAKKL